MSRRSRREGRFTTRAVAWAALLAAAFTLSARAADAQSEDAAELGAKLSNPVSDVSAGVPSTPAAREGPHNLPMRDRGDFGRGQDGEDDV